MNLSPALLKAQLVRGSKCARSTLNSLNYYSWFSICFSISSEQTLEVVGALTFYQFFKLGLATLAYKRLFQQNLVYQPVYVRPTKSLEFSLTQSRPNSPLDLWADKA